MPHHHSSETSGKWWMEQPVDPRPVIHPVGRARASRRFSLISLWMRTFELRHPVWMKVLCVLILVLFWVVIPWFFGYMAAQDF